MELRGLANTLGLGYGVLPVWATGPNQTRQTWHPDLLLRMRQASKTFSTKVEEALLKLLWSEETEWCSNCSWLKVVEGKRPSSFFPQKSKRRKSSLSAANHSQDFIMCLECHMTLLQCKVSSCGGAAVMHEAMAFQSVHKIFCRRRFAYGTVGFLSRRWLSALHKYIAHVVMRSCLLPRSSFCLGLEKP